MDYVYFTILNFQQNICIAKLNLQTNALELTVLKKELYERHIDCPFKTQTTIVHFHKYSRFTNSI